MKLAVVAGGWHWPADFFEKIASEANGAELFVVAHRNPELPVVSEEKLEILRMASGPMVAIDREIYSRFLTVQGLRGIGWEYSEAPNTMGDWGFFNQWLETHDYRKYDVILNCHDDTFIRRPGIFHQLAGDWLVLSNGRYPQAPEPYLRGSFEFWKREMLDRLGGRFDLGDIGLTREGKTDSPGGLAALSEWNNIGVPLRRFMVDRGLTNRVAYLSGFYRISPWVIEGERGFMHFREGAPWSFDAGLNEYPLEVAS